MKILVVHGQKEVIEKVKSVLDTHESIIRFSDSGLDGLLASRVENFDLIICGTDLPVITGFELVRSIKTNSINKHTPVIFVDNTVTNKTEQLGKTLGVTGIYNLQEFNEQLAAIINEQIKVTPDNNWDDLLARTELSRLSQIA
jgi:CheY-like chemotaxis protein